MVQVALEFDLEASSSAQYSREFSDTDSSRGLEGGVSIKLFTLKKLNLFTLFTFFMGYSLYSLFILLFLYAIHLFSWSIHFIFVFHVLFTVFMQD